MRELAVDHREVALAQVQRNVHAHAEGVDRHTARQRRVGARGRGRHTNAVGVKAVARAVAGERAGVVRRARVDPEVGGVARKVQGAVAPQALRHVQVDLLALAVGRIRREAVLLRRQGRHGVLQRVVIGGGVAVRRKAQVGVGAGEQLGPSGVHTGAVLVAFSGFVELGQRQVGDHGAPVGVDRCACQGRVVALSREQGAVQRPGVAQAILHIAFGHILVACGVHVVELAAHQAVAHAAFAQRHGRGRERHVERAHRAVRLGDADHQVAAKARGVQVGDVEGAGGHDGIVNDDVVLSNLHLGVAQGHAVDGGRKAALGVGVHALVGHERGANDREAVEQLAV